MLKSSVLAAVTLMTALFSAALCRAADLPLRPSITGDVPPSPDDTHFFLHIGPAGMLTDESAKIKAFGQRVPGATIKIDPVVTAAIEAGYFITPNFAVALAGGVPPEIPIQAAGTIAGVGKLGSIVAGPMALTAQYHFTGFGAFQPYVGVGPMYLVVFNNKDGALSDLRVDPAWGAVGQVGVDVMMTQHWGAFFDIKKAYLRTNAKGKLGAAPITSQVRLDPLALTGGVTYRF